MAEAGGPQSRVDTIEIDPLHADIAEMELSRKGLADRVRVLRGDDRDILPTLTGPYDVFFLDDGRREEMWPILKRLASPGGVLIDTGPLKEDLEKLVALLKKHPDMGKEAEDIYRDAVKRGMIVL